MAAGNTLMVGRGSSAAAAMLILSQNARARFGRNDTGSAGASSTTTDRGTKLASRALLLYADFIRALRKAATASFGEDGR
jgi:hypothetical protein